MKKKFVSMVLSLILLMSLAPSDVFAEEFPTSLEAPANVGVTASIENGDIYNYKIAFSYPPTVLDISEKRSTWSKTTGHSNLQFGYEFDYKYNENGNWHHTSVWDGVNLAPEPFHRPMVVEKTKDFAAYIKAADLADVPKPGATLDNNTVYFRFRTTVAFKDPDGNKGVLISPWSDTAAVGKNATNKELNLEAPVLTKAELMRGDSGAYLISVTCPVPDSIRAIDNSSGSVYVRSEYRVDNGQWQEISANHHLDGVFEINPENVGTGGDIKLEAGFYEIRARFAYFPEGSVRASNWSPYSNIVSIGAPAFYKGASSWATPELDKAAGYGLITDRVKDNMSGNITREEFAEIAVKLYEVYTGNKAEAGSVTFSDTTNPEILKAANLGMVLGIGEGKFGPTLLVTREQMATILLRTLKVINSTADFSTAGAAKFSDDKDIAGWAKDGVYYCFKAGIIKGIGSNKFGPRSNSTREAAAIVCTRAYELYMKK